jgi:hypothetical protein
MARCTLNVGNTLYVLSKEGEEKNKNKNKTNGKKGW